MNINALASRIKKLEDKTMPTRRSLETIDYREKLRALRRSRGLPDLDTPEYCIEQVEKLKDAAAIAQNILGGGAGDERKLAQVYFITRQLPDTAKRVGRSDLLLRIEGYRSVILAALKVIGNGDHKKVLRAHRLPVV